MWIFTFLPEWVIHLIFVAGILGIIAGFLLGFIPFVSRYKLPIQIISILVFALGVYLEGGLSDYKEWEFKVAEMQVKMAKLEAEGAKANVQIQEKVVEKTKVIREKGKDVIKYIDNVVVKKEEIVRYIEQCPVPKELIDVHNQATEIGGSK